MQQIFHRSTSTSGVVKNGRKTCRIRRQEVPRGAAHPGRQRKLADRWISGGFLGFEKIFVAYSVSSCVLRTHRHTHTHTTWWWKFVFHGLLCGVQKDRCAIFDVWKIVASDRARSYGYFDDFQIVVKGYFFPVSKTTTTTTTIAGVCVCCGSSVAPACECIGAVSSVKGAIHIQEIM